MTTDMDARWYALQVRPRFEKAVAKNLEGKGFEEFLPLYARKSNWSDRVKTLELPLFPGYVFCRFNVNHRLPILMVPGVSSVVSVGRIPMPIEDREINDIRSVLASGSAYEPWPTFGVGQLVRVEHGALAGVQGTVEIVKNSYRLVISVNLLQRSVAVEIDADAVSAISTISQVPAIPPVPFTPVKRSRTLIHGSL